MVPEPVLGSRNVALSEVLVGAERACKSEVCNSPSTALSSNPASSCCMLHINHCPHLQVPAGARPFVHPHPQAKRSENDELCRIIEALWLPLSRARLIVLVRAARSRCNSRPHNCHHRCLHALPRLLTVPAGEYVAGCRCR